MSLHVTSRFDADASLRLLAVGLALVTLVAWAFTISLEVALGLTASIVVVALAVGLNARGVLHPLWPFAVLATLLPLNGLRPTPGVSVGDVALVATGIAVLPFVRRAAPPPHVVVPLVGTLVITAGGLLGMITTQDWGGVAEMAKFVVGAPLVIVIVILMNPSQSTAIFLLKFYALGGAISSVAAMTSFGSIDPAFGRSSGLGAHMGHLALAGVFGFFVMLGWAMSTRSLVIRVVAGLTAILCMYGNLLSGTRSSTIGLIVGLVYLAFTARLKGITILGATGALALAVYFFIVPLLPQAASIQRAFGQGPLAALAGQSTNEHANQLVESFRFIGIHPWTGSGFSQGLIAHNLILQVASVGGLVALVGLFVVWSPFYLLLFRRLAVGMTRASVQQTCLLAGVLAYFVFAQFEPLIWDRHLWFFITLTLIAQTNAEGHTDRDGDRNVAQPAHG